MLESLCETKKHNTIVSVGIQASGIMNLPIIMAFMKPKSPKADQYQRVVGLIYNNNP